MKNISFRFLLLCAFIVIIFNKVYSQDVDSLVYFDDLKFLNELEENAFSNYLDNKDVNFIDLFISGSDSCSDYESDLIRTKINKQIAEFNDPDFRKLKDKKKIKKIFNGIHDKYLKKYKTEAYFNDLFTKGEYNCVTASAFYALLFEGLEIPYSIKRSYDHVYLVAYPESYVFLVESTNPMRGYMEFNDKAKQQFVQFMADSKLISSAEFYQKSTDELFNEYYFEEDDIDLVELAGVQYYNRSLGLIEQSLYSQAFILAEKSYFLFPFEQAGYVLLFAASNVLVNCDYEDIKYADYIYKLSRYKNLGITNNDLYSLFLDVNQKLLVAEYNTNMYYLYYHRIVDNISDSSLIDDISFVYNYERGRILINNSKFSSALPYIENSYRIKPKHVDAKNMFFNSLLYTIINLSPPDSALTEYNQYLGQYPELLENSKFSNLQYTLMLTICVESFSYGNYPKAFEYLGRFENGFSGSTISKNSYLINNMIQDAYSRAASHYFRKGDYKTAKKYLNKGLEYVPNSFELKHKLQNLD